MSKELKHIVKNWITQEFVDISNKYHKLCDDSFTAYQGKTLENLWFGNKLDLGHLRIFGCVDHVLILNLNKKKIDSKSKLY